MANGIKHQVAQHTANILAIHFGNGILRTIQAYLMLSITQHFCLGNNLGEQLVEVNLLKVRLLLVCLQP